MIVDALERSVDALESDRPGSIAPFNGLAAEELGKGTGCNAQVALFQKQAGHLVAQIQQASVQLLDAGSGQQGNTWMMHLAQAQSYCPPSVSWMRHGAACPSRQL